MRRLRVREAVDVDADAGHLDVREHGNQRVLEIAIHAIEAWRRRSSATRGSASDSGRSARSPANVARVEAGTASSNNGLGTSAGNVLFAHRAIVLALQAELRNRMARLGRVDQIAQDHRVGERHLREGAPAVQAGNGHELQIVAELFNRGVREDRPEAIEHVAYGQIRGVGQPGVGQSGCSVQSPDAPKTPSRRSTTRRLRRTFRWCEANRLRGRQLSCQRVHVVDRSDHAIVARAASPRWARTPEQDCETPVVEKSA